MKKMLCALLVALTLVSSFAVANGEQALTVFQSPNGYSFKHPLDWTLIDGNIYEVVHAKVDAGEWAEIASATDALTIVTDEVPNTVVAIAPDGKRYVSVDSMANPGYKEESSLIALTSVLLPMIAEHCAVRMDSFEVTDPGSSYKTEAYEYALMTATYKVGEAKMKLSVYGLTLANGLFFVCMAEPAGVEAADAALLNIVASFTVGE